MKRLFIFAAALVVLAFSGQAEPTLLNGVAVIVNDAVITYKEVFTAMADDEEFLVRRYASQPQVLEQKRRELMQERIELLVETRLILDEFKKAGYNLPESVIEERVNKDIRSYGNRLTLMKTLQAKGLTYESYRKRKRDEVIVMAMSEHFVPHDPVVSPHRMETYYRENLERFRLPDQVKIRMIELTNRPNDTAFFSKKLAEEITAKLDEGAPFEEMAKIYSQGSKASAGGDFGWVDKKFLRPELAEKAFALQAGERSAVIETPEACYILLVEETRPSYVRPLSEVRDEVENTLKSEEIKRLHKRWIERLKQKSFIRYFD
jgi:peptidyl-prolyl cis-trans isomerase SurA